MSVVTRFAPSPSGLLHLGHAYSALRAHDFARETGGRFLLRIEDIDFNRCKREFEPQILDDLEWLGISWEKPVRRQSEHLGDYEKIVNRLDQMGLLYPCFCTRREILLEIERSGGAPHGKEGPVYPGTCRSLGVEERQQRIEEGQGHALRLDLGASLERVEMEALGWSDIEQGEQQPDRTTWEEIGDVVLVRKDIGTSYHIAVVGDDALQGITHVIRGLDLLDSTPIHRLLQALLGLPHPDYLHHALVRDEQGKRLAKRDESCSLVSLREGGVTPAEVRQRLQLPPPS